MAEQRLIDAEHFLKRVLPLCIIPNELKKNVDDEPTVDAVPVVRCKDCVHRDPEDKGCDCGSLARQGCLFPVDDNYFCGYGERKDGGINARTNPQE